MEKTVCDGCGMGEPKNLPDSKKTIRPVKLVIQNDMREATMPETADRHVADLCNTCRTFVVGKFFRGSTDDLVLPVFLSEPSEHEREIRIAT